MNASGTIRKLQDEVAVLKARVAELETVIQQMRDNNSLTSHPTVQWPSTSVILTDSQINAHKFRFLTDDDAKSMEQLLEEGWNGDLTYPKFYAPGTRPKSDTPPVACSIVVRREGQDLFGFDYRDSDSTSMFYHFATTADPDAKEVALMRYAIEYLQRQVDRISPDAGSKS